MADSELVSVEVVVNFDGLRRGWVGQVELTERIQLLIGRGYLRLLGHVQPDVVLPPAVVEPPPAAVETPEVVTPTETPAQPPKRSRAKQKATTTPAEGSDGGSAGGVRLE